MEPCVDALKEWAGKANATIIYDSTVDEFTDNGLFNKVKGKPNIAVIGFTTDGDVFGGFFRFVVWNQHERFYDPNMFIFSFESHGRCKTPQRFDVKEGLKESAYVIFWKNGNGCVAFYVDGLGFSLGNERSDSCCLDMSRVFEGIQDTTLTGKNGWLFEKDKHHCVRLVAVKLGN